MHQAIVDPYKFRAEMKRKAVQLLGNFRRGTVDNLGLSCKVKDNEERAEVVESYRLRRPEMKRPE